MANQFSLVYLTTPGSAPPDMIRWAGQAGFDFVSLRTIPMGLPNEPNFSLAANKELFRRTREALEQTGVRLHDTETARIYDGVDPKRYVPEMEAARELDARCILTNVWTPDRTFVVDKFAELCNLAKPLGLTVILEFVTWASIATMADALDVIRQSRADNAALVVDALHFNRSRCTMHELEQTAPELLRFVHLCDAPAQIPTTTEGLIHAGRAERLYPGEGAIDLAGMIRRLPPMVYGVEVPHLARAREIGNAEHVRRSLDTTKAYFAAHGL